MKKLIAECFGSLCFWKSPVGLARALVLAPSLANAADCDPITITLQPQSQYVLENCIVTFTVKTTGTSPHLFQWFRDQQPLLGATNSSYTIEHATMADNGARFHATAINACSQSTSDIAVLAISQDVIPPRLLRARGDYSMEQVIVTFVAGCAGGPGLDSISAEDPFNYRLSGGIIVSNAVLDASRTNVVLRTTRQSPDTLYTLTVNNVMDLTGNVITAGSETAFQSWAIVPGSDPPIIVPPPVTIVRAGTNIFVSWPPGSVAQQANSVTGPWETIADAARPHKATIDAMQFYRALFVP